MRNFIRTCSEKLTAICPKRFFLAQATVKNSGSKITEPKQIHLKYKKLCAIFKRKTMS